MVADMDFTFIFIAHKDAMSWDAVCIQDNNNCIMLLTELWLFVNVC